ncbi:MAG: hypothetical protein P1U32_01590 [Legionellaceae bacterium]|nr:hypothetical protein [Legionellaceae bacterium]
MSADIVKTSLVSTAVGGIGGLFAPAAANAAGGLLNVMGACAIGGAIVYPFASILLTLTGINAFKKKYPSSAVYNALTGLELFVSALLAAEIGAAVLGIPAHPVFICSLVGAVSLLALTFVVGLAVIIGVACFFSNLKAEAAPATENEENTPIALLN